MIIGYGEWNTESCFDTMARIQDNAVDLVLTDVPYNEVNRKSGGLRNLDKGTADSPLFDMEVLCSEIGRICSGSVYMFCGFKQVSEISRLLENAGFSIRVGVWQKTNPSPMNGTRMWLSGVELCVFGRKKNATFNEHCKGAVWPCASERSKIHPTQKPEKLFTRLIDASSNEGDLVYDPFAGSGTTAVCCNKLTRRWVCSELDVGFSKLATDRIKNILL